MIASSQKVIDGHTFTVTQLPATEGLKIWTQLVKLFSPSLGSLADGTTVGKSLLDANVSGDSLGKMLSKLSENLQEDTVLVLCKRLLATMTIDGRQIQFDLDFAGKYMLLFKAVGFALEANYSDFFDGIKSFVGRATIASAAPAMPTTGLPATPPA